MRFYVGLHIPNYASDFERVFVSINKLRRYKDFRVGCKDWIMDSGAFTEISTHGRYRDEPEEFADQVNRVAAANPGLVAVVSQDWMCEPWIIERTGLSVREHQQRTIERYDRLRELIWGVYLMPVLQGYHVSDYLAHIDQYGDRLKPRMHVGVGSICRRNTNVGEIEGLLTAITRKRADLRLHGFGLKVTALRSKVVCDGLWSADSMAWSYAARRQGRDPNDYREAMAFVRMIERKTPVSSQEAAFEEVKIDEARRYFKNETWRRPEPFPRRF